jgi:hypothetical protein
MAIVAVACLTARASADPLPAVPMALVDAPPAFDGARFTTALETYVVNAQVSVRLVPVMTDDAVCASLLVAPTQTAVWARWTATTIQLSVATAEKGCGAVETSTVDIPKDQPAFVYRVAALKVASLLRTLPAPPAPPPPAPTPLPALPGVVPPPRHVDTRTPVAVELGATGVASGSKARRTSSLVLGAWFGKTVSLGGSLLASAAQDADAPGGSGTARMFGALVGGRMTFPLGGRLAIISEVDVGVLSVGSSADRVTGAAAMSDREWTPILSFDPHLAVRVAGPLYVLVGPTLDLATHSVDISLGDTPLYHASLVRFRWDVRAQIWF